MSPLARVLVLALFAASLVCWLVLLRTWRLAGPAALPRAALGRQEHVARRSLRALLAFDALVIVPVSVPAVIGTVLAREPELAVLFLAGLLVFVGPIPSLLRNVRALEARRLAGVPEPEEERRSTGHQGLDRLLRRPPYAT